MGGEWICTRKLAARLYPDLDSHANQFLRYALGLDAWVPENLHAHRALYDCYVTAALFIRISRDSSWSVEEMLEISAQPVLLKTLRIGKHKGKTFAEVAKEDPSWLKWALSTISDMSDDMRFTIQHYLKTNLMKFEKAMRKKAKLRLALTGPSGAGKTYSALVICKSMGEKRQL
ncbi:Exodeoxyribonuclease 10 [Hafnia alvei]|nr:Exodeoxyribonuclease 10 [Hafnia alvei]